MNFCCICREEIDVHPISGWAGGHNAEPVLNGRCCTACNDAVVTPTRLRYLRRALVMELAAEKKAKSNA